ncbi:cell wall-binding protein, partial [Akkermansia sp. GGCC_0220]|nr:cell wall-binding protein [Akkermansia sp. GGCC_0220]
GGADEVYLKNITLDKSNIGYFVNKKNYNIESDENGQLVKLEVETFGDEYSVFVNGNKLDFTNSLSLKFKGIGKY